MEEYRKAQGPRDGAQLLFEIVSECYERKSLVITTNIEFSRSVNVLYDEQMTGALLDRLLHHLLIFEGEAYEKLTCSAGVT
ncbi:MAG: ATP-binding protein [Bacillota bacterium]|jgi:DNA replication protein DnaC